MSTSSRSTGSEPLQYPPVIGSRSYPLQNRGEEAAAKLALAREEGIREGERCAAANFERMLSQQRESVRIAVNEFAAARDLYFRRVESEVVHLALAIARKLLQREVAIDPLLLTGVVRVCLDRLREANEIELHVAAPQGEQWRALLAHEPIGGAKVKIVDEPSFAPDQCRVDSNLGSVELGVEAQLKEVERSLLDVMAARPR